MKKFLLTSVAFLMVLVFLGLSNPKEAQAQLSLELLGKLGGASTYLTKESFGDSIFDVTGGLQFSPILRFEMGLGIGLNINWTMIEQRLKKNELTNELGVTDRWMTTQHPSFGLTMRYEIFEFLEAGIFLNYGFGSVKLDLQGVNSQPNVAAKYGLNGANLKWSLQSFEIGFLTNFAWRIPNTFFSVVLGMQFYMDFSRMYAADDSLSNSTDAKNRNVDENGINTFGFLFTFGGRYDFHFESFGRAAPQN